VLLRRRIKLNITFCFPDRAAQRDPAATAGVEEAEEVEEPVIGGDYTLVYEDDEGDRVLVGDVPWE
jgi:auxin-responsive protein IAA